ncbi:hypothetical protein H6G20_00010 [Desertifilum sp. FACHB-1129]|uniref:Outer membrane protein beta-barrel domain-containing protein n=1 Tax=Desertifilum tharense IPPAS B-1220 TaxID=1781255 RepID=A0A1E5QJH2_9CYAN|nr:hypothetical protein [Desertifilum tharense]MBD2310064.1 hypothetical protein [Desertifilum sp. FACHB-1129]MBD2322132.1 hypothetical protein [Desertifilum sp. FACHB-866]MBD2333789.1 hypothetical protein [Desertifilum sp. FACHB-868]OEJ74751.1 hypothetical protein BH720_12790 [Desertifilum tharense IPPAS B-1220]
MRQQFLVFSLLFSLLAIAPPVRSQPAADELDISPEILESSPVLQRWRENIPDLLEEIRRNPSFRTRVRLGYSHFPASDDKAGFNVGVEDVFIGRTGLALGADYNGTFGGEVASVGGELRYYALPLGGYLNVAPTVGYRYLQTDDYSRGGLNVGVRLMLVPSRGGAADIALSQNFVSPRSGEEVGITTLSFGYAVTPNFRISTDIQKQNARESRDSRVGVVLEWMP